MLLRPRMVYRNLAYSLGCIIVLYTVYSIVAYDDGTYIRHPNNPRHLYLTLDKNRMDHRFEKLAPKRILMWTSIFGNYPSNKHMLECPGLSDRCIIDHNRSIFASANAVIFHGSNLNEGFPDPKTRKKTQRYVFMSMEAPGNIQRVSLPKHYFNWSMTHLFSSDVVFKYGSFWLTTKEAELRGFKINDMYLPSRVLRKSKTGVFGLISNCDTTSKRELVIKELSKYMPVTIAGACALDPSHRDLCPGRNSCEEIFAQYPFFFAMENTNCEDYVTEKYWERHMIPSVPIVMRRGIYKNQNLPPKSVIAMDDFANVQEMAEYLMKLEKDENAYAEYFKWRNGGWTLAPWNAPGYRNGYCKLCEKLWDEKQSENTIENIWSWFDAESKCEGSEYVQDWLKSE